MPLDDLVDGFVQKTADRARSLVGSVVSRVSDKYNPRGPLAAFNENKFAISKIQYPINLGSGPNLSYIKFNILENVGVEGKTSGEGIAAVNKNKQNSQLESIIRNVTDVTGRAGSDIISGAADILDISSDTKSSIASFAKQLGLSPQQFTTQRRVKKTGTVVALYMPHTMVFSQQNTYNPFSYTQQLTTPTLLAQGADAALKGDLSGAGTAIAEAGGRAFLSDEQLGALLYGFTGKALNPQIEVIYQETALRNFQFEFVLAARSKEESNQIKLIIQTFRKASAPSFAGADGAAGRYLIPPSEFDIEFFFNAQQLPTVPKISTCVLTNFETDFAPSGQFSTFWDGEPMSVRIRLDFMETEIITKQRIDQGF